MIEQNEIRTRDYLWTNKIVGEVFPTAVTPSTWSVWQAYFDKLSLGDTPSIDNIGGRPYLNYSAMYAFLKKIVRKEERVRGMIRDSIGVPPEGVDIPSFPISWKTILFEILPREIKNELRKRKLRKSAAQFLEMVREQCQGFQRRIGRLQGEDLISLWSDELWPVWNEIHFLQDKQNEELNLLLSKSKTALTKLLGADEADMFLTTISSAGEIASVGPLVGLFRLSKGELSRQEYLWRYGHRGPNENELFEPRQYEDPRWLDKQLQEFMRTPIDVDQLFAERVTESAVALREVKQRLSSDKAAIVERQLRAIERTNSDREATRSELTRLVSVMRRWFLQAGDITGLGDRVFFLTVDETIEVLGGEATAVEYIPARQETFEAYRALPSLPMWIRGSFDPVEWAADPHRRKDVFDPYAVLPSEAPKTDTVLKGQPGSAGLAEGMVRHIVCLDEGDQLQPGEILITSTTNVGWTPLFPRAAAVITDVGGSLSHAAIVARELGIPAVVGCGSATTRLRTGDRVRVDGGRGKVEILRRRKDG